MAREHVAALAEEVVPQKGEAGPVRQYLSRDLKTCPMLIFFERNSEMWVELIEKITLFKYRCAKGEAGTVRQNLSREWYSQKLKIEALTLAHAQTILYTSN